MNNGGGAATFLPQGSKLASYMTRGGGQPQQPQPPQPPSFDSLSKGLHVLQLGPTGDSPSSTSPSNGINAPVPVPVPGGIKKSFSVSGLSSGSIQEFVPGTQFNGGTGNRFQTGATGTTTTANTQGNNGAFSRQGGLSPRHSPTPGSVAAAAQQQQQPQQDLSAAASSGDITTYSDGGTTYFYNPGDEMASANNNGGQTSTGGHHHQGGGGGGGGGGGPEEGSILTPDYSSYAGTPSYVANVKVRANVPGFMSENEMKVDILKRQHICLSQVDPESYPNLPSEVDNFTNLCPLEPPPPNPMHKSHTFGYVTSVYKATNMKTNLHVCLRRIHGYRLVNTKCMMLVEQWRKLSHSNLVALRQVFTTKSFGDHSMVFVYDLYPGAETLMAKHFNSPSQVGGAFLDPFSGTDGSARPYSQQKNHLLRQQAMMAQNGLLAESLIWTYVIQLTSALRHIHSAGLACRTLDPTKILVINKSRLLLNCGGIFDVITFDSSQPNPMSNMVPYQQEDLISLGKIVLALACNSFLAIQRENLQTSMEIVATTYSGDLRNLIMYLLTNQQRIKSVNDLMPMIGARFYTQLDAAYMRSDVVESELAKEIESTRLFRLLTKLSTVVDRAELNGDYGWAEYGDRYMLKLFRDYVFHQVMEDSRPWLDMAHVISCLNKLDAGIPDKVCLMSRDEQNVLVVSYAELKQCLEQSFNECIHASGIRQPQQQLQHNY